MVYAADLWNLVLDSTAKSDDLPMGPGTPRFYLAQLVLGSVFIEYLSHFSLIPSCLTNAIVSPVRFLTTLRYSDLHVSQTLVGYLPSLAFITGFVHPYMSIGMLSPDK